MCSAAPFSTVVGVRQNRKNKSERNWGDSSGMCAGFTSISSLKEVPLCKTQGKCIFKTFLVVLWCRDNSKLYSVLTSSL